MSGRGKHDWQALAKAWKARRNDPARRFPLPLTEAKQERLETARKAVRNYWLCRAGPRPPPSVRTRQAAGGKRKPVTLAKVSFIEGVQ